MPTYSLCIFLGPSNERCNMNPSRQQPSGCLFRSPGLWRKASVTLAVTWLAACSSGDGASNTGTGTGPATTASITMQGLAATGMPIDNAAVTARCASGADIAASTAVGGAFTLPFTSAHAGPCMLRVSGGSPGVTLYSFIGSIQTGNINITPITDLIVARALGADPADAFSHFDATRAETIAKGMGVAKTWVETQVRIVTGDSFFSVDPFTGKFAVGDVNDKVLDALGSSAAAVSKSLADLRAAAITNSAVLLAQPLTYEISSENALAASQLSMKAPLIITLFIDGILDDVPESVFAKLDEINNQRAAAVKRKAVAQVVSEACSHGGKVTVQESDTALTLNFDNCTKNNEGKIGAEMTAYTKSKKINGMVVFTDTELKDYPEATEVMINLSESITDTLGREQNSRQKGFLVTGDDDNGYVIQKMTLTTRFWGKTSASAQPYDYSVEAQNFSVTVDEANDRESFSGVINAKGKDEAGNVFPGGSFRVEMVVPLNGEETQGEYKIVGAKNTMVLTRLDPKGFYLTTNNTAPKFYPTEDSDTEDPDTEDPDTEDPETEDSDS